MEPWIERFNSIYPFVEVVYAREYVYGSPPPMAKKVRDELASDLESADMVLSAISPHLKMQALGMFRTYLSKEKNRIPYGFKDEQGYWTSILLLPTILAYNPETTRVDELPRSPEELVDEKWMGRITLHDPTYGTFGADWLSSLRAILGEKRWNLFVERLAALKPRRFPLFRHIVESVSSGESRIGLTVLLYEYLKAKDQGRPIERFSIDEIPLLTSATAASILSSGRHQRSAELFIDFLLSKEGQEMIGNSYIRIPAAIGTDAKFSLERLVEEPPVPFPSREVIEQSGIHTELYKEHFH